MFLGRYTIWISSRSAITEGQKLTSNIALAKRPDGLWEQGSWGLANIAIDDLDGTAPEP